MNFFYPAQRTVRPTLLSSPIFEARIMQRFRVLFAFPAAVLSPDLFSPSRHSFSSPTTFVNHYKAISSFEVQSEVIHWAFLFTKDWPLFFTKPTLVDYFNFLNFAFEIVPYFLIQPTLAPSFFSHSKFNCYLFTAFQSFQWVHFELALFSSISQLFPLT